jgi:hypothetical protein
VSYASVTNATSYSVEAATNVAFTANRVTVSGAPTTQSLTGAVVGDHFVRVRAIDPFGAAGQWSPVQQIQLRGYFYLIRDSDERLRRLDPVTNTISDVGPLGILYEFGGCAWNPANSTLYMVDGRHSPSPTNSLYRVNLTTGAATLVGAHGIGDMFSIAYHPPTDALYGVSVVTDQLYRFNLATGAATAIGSTGPTLPYIGGLVWDPVRARLVAISAGPGELYSMNIATGLATSLGASPGSVSDVGLGYNPVNDRLVAADYAGSVFEYNPVAPFARTTRLSAQGTHTCIAFVP